MTDHNIVNSGSQTVEISVAVDHTSDIYDPSVFIRHEQDRIVVYRHYPDFT